MNALPAALPAQGKVHAPIALLASKAIAAIATVAAGVVGMPQAAFAASDTQVVEGTMVIAMQKTAAAAAATGSLPATGDAPLLPIAGAIALLAAVAFLSVSRRQLATNNAGHATPIGPSAKKNSGRGGVIVALLATCLCLGMYFGTTALAGGVLANVEGTSAVVVDKDGNVLSSKLKVANGSGQDITLKSIAAPDELSSWNAGVKEGTVIKKDAEVTGTWDGKTIPDAVLKQLKSNNARVELKFKMTFSGAVLDFGAFKVSTDPVVYNGQQAKPAVTSDTYTAGTDYEVAYGENIDAGTGTVTIKGIGDYKGEKTYDFEIVPREVTVSGITAQDKTYDRTKDAVLVTTSAVIDGKLDKDELGVAATGAFDDENAGEKKQVNISSLELTGKDAANYKLAEAGQQTKTEATIDQREVTVSFKKVDSKTYNGNTKATFHLYDVVMDGRLGDDNLQVEATATFEDKNVGVDKKVYISDLRLTGLKVANYKLAETGQATETKGTIAKRKVNVGWYLTEQIYQRWSDPVYVNITNIVKGETLEYSLSYYDGNTLLAERPHEVGTYRVELTLSDEQNYTVSEEDRSSDFVISPCAVTVSGITAKDKAYDGTTTAELDVSKVKLTFEKSQFLAEPPLGVTATGTFENAEVGTGKKVTISDLALTGEEAANYRLAETGQQTETTASITAKP